jgi:hypothetical protein
MSVAEEDKEEMWLPGKGPNKGFKKSLSIPLFSSSLIFINFGFAS